MNNNKDCRVGQLTSGDEDDHDVMMMVATWSRSCDETSSRSKTSWSSFTPMCRAEKLQCAQSVFVFDLYFLNPKDFGLAVNKSVDMMK